jgi:outer membrane protein insertion porin family
MARATVEMSFPIIEKARGAIFYDTGFVNPDSWDFSEETLSVPRGPNAQATAQYFGTPLTVRRTYDNIASDFGVGLRLDLPIGPLRLDYGFPLQTAGNGKHGHLNFSVGYQF